MRIRQLREERGLTQTELARKSGLAQPTLSELERGSKTNPSLKVLRRLADALGIDVADLIKEEAI